MEDDITVIAGANNSGKTSIVELFNYVFNAKGGLCCDDFPVYESQKWCTAVFPYFQTQFNQGNEKEDLIANILGTIMPSENPEKRPSPILCKPPMWCKIERTHWRNFYDKKKANPGRRGKKRKDPRTAAGK